LNLKLKLSDCDLLGCDTVQQYRTMLPPSSGWRWRWYDFLKCWYPTTLLCGITIQKTVTWTFINVETLSLAWNYQLSQNVTKHWCMAYIIQLIMIYNFYLN